MLHIYYSAGPETSKEFISENEWSYRFEGKVATDVITSPFGDPLSQAGDVRDGGDFYSRMGAVACWSSVTDETGNGRSPPCLIWSRRHRRTALRQSSSSAMRTPGWKRRAGWPPTP